MYKYVGILRRFYKSKLFFINSSFYFKSQEAFVVFIVNYGHWSCLVKIASDFKCVHICCLLVCIFTVNPPLNGQIGEDVLSIFWSKQHHMPDWLLTPRVTVIAPCVQLRFYILSQHTKETSLHGGHFHRVYSLIRKSCRRTFLCDYFPFGPLLPNFLDI